MKVLKFTMVLVMLLCIGTFAEAQYDDYLNTALTLLDKGDCDNAERNYDVYKKLTGKTSSLVEKGIAECKNSNRQSANGAKQIQINYQNYEVLPSDLDGTYNWEEAQSACNNLTAFGKSDWYLPDIKELEAIATHNVEIGGFVYGPYYWSSSVSSNDSAKSGAFLGESGGFTMVERKKEFDFHVRCIRKY